MKAYAKKTYGKKGDAVVQKNWDAIDIAISGLQEVKVPAEWANATTGAEAAKVKGTTEYFDDLRASHPGAGRRQAARERHAIPAAWFPPAPPSSRSAALP